MFIKFTLVHCQIGKPSKPKKYLFAVSLSRFNDFFMKFHCQDGIFSAERLSDFFADFVSSFHKTLLLLVFDVLTFVFELNDFVSKLSRPSSEEASVFWEFSVSTVTASASGFSLSSFLNSLCKYVFGYFLLYERRSLDFITENSRKSGFSRGSTSRFLLTLITSTRLYRELAVTSSLWPAEFPSLLFAERFMKLGCRMRDSWSTAICVTRWFCNHNNFNMRNNQRVGKHYWLGINCSEYDANSIILDEIL